MANMPSSRNFFDKKSQGLCPGKKIFMDSKNPASGGGVFAKLEGCFEEGRTYSILMRFLDEARAVRLRLASEYIVIIVLFA